MKQIVKDLFLAYGRENEIERMAIYIGLFQEFPPELVRKACHKAILEYKFLPSVSELVGSMKSLVGEASPDSRVKPWSEAWDEINKKMLLTPWGQTPEWSTKEIEMAVNAFGWNDLQRSLEKDMPLIRPQMRKIYEDTCKRASEKRINEYILNGNNQLLQGKIKKIGVMANGQ